MGEKLQNLKTREAEGLLRGLPREATCPPKPWRRRKPFTWMAKWEIRFQRFAISFRPSALDVCRFRHQHFLPRGETLRGLSREVEPFTRGNEKFHLGP